MNLLPQASGTRPRLACEISAQGVVAARAETGVAPLQAVARVGLAGGAVAPGLKPGNVVDRVAVVAAIRRAVEEIGVRANSRGADLTLVIPDAAARVLLLDFDALPGKLTEALPIVRFRLKKMLPFDADDAMVTFQVMSTNRSLVRVLAVAIPRDVLSEYETAAREAGFEPGAVLPSTLACVAATDETDGPALLINANPLGVTTAIVRSGVLLLHRSVDLQAAEIGKADEIGSEGPIVVAPISMRAFAEELVQAPALLAGTTVEIATEIAQAVSVAAAYYEDTLASVPTRILCAGPLGAEALQDILIRNELAQADGLRVGEIVDPSALLGDAVTSSVPRGLLAGVLGALRG